MYDGTITASSGRGPDAVKVTLKDPKYQEGMKVKDWVKEYGEDIVLNLFLSARTIAIQKPMQAVLKSENGTVEGAIKAGEAKANDLTPSKRSGIKKSKRKTRAEVEADFTAKGLDINDPAIQAVINGLFA